MKRSDDGRCVLKHCNGTVRYYDGAMGYEAMVCQTCGAHYTVQGDIAPDWPRYNAIVAKARRNNK